MKCLVSVFVVLGLLAPLYGESVILYEDFEGAPAGTPLNTLGWSGYDNIVISDAVIDSGQSADWAWADSSSEWPSVTKNFAYAPAAGDSYTLTATVYAPGTGGEYADVRIANSADPTAVMQGMLCGYDEMVFGIINTTDTIKIKPQPTIATDLKMVLHGDSTECFYRAHGAAEWIAAGEMTGLGWSLSTFDQVVIYGHGGKSGGVDSVRLTVTPVPEPSAIMMIAAGIFGLLACAWRKHN